MRVEIRLFAGLACGNSALPCFGESEFVLELPDGITVRELRGIMAITPALPLMSIVNDRHEEEDRVLRDGDRIGMFPPIGGG